MFDITWLLSQCLSPYTMTPLLWCGDFQKVCLIPFVYPFEFFLFGNFIMIHFVIRYDSIVFIIIASENSFGNLFINGSLNYFSSDLIYFSVQHFLWEFIRQFAGKISNSVIPFKFSSEISYEPFLEILWEFFRLYLCEILWIFFKFPNNSFRKQLILNWAYGVYCFFLIPERLPEKFPNELPFPKKLPKKIDISHRKELRKILWKLFKENGHIQFQNK